MLEECKNIEAKEAELYNFVEIAKKYLHLFINSNENLPLALDIKIIQERCNKLELEFIRLKDNNEEIKSEIMDNYERRNSTNIEINSYIENIVKRVKKGKKYFYLSIINALVAWQLLMIINI